MECKHIKQGIRINEDGSVVPCCEFTGNIGIFCSSSFTFESYLESENVAKIRTGLMNDEWPYGCKNCANNEARKHLSLRQRGLAEISSGLVLDLVIGNECNSDCVMCYSGQSSKINSRLRKSKPTFEVPDDDRYWIETSSIDGNWSDHPGFWQQVTDRLDDIETIKFLGGEPLLSKKLWEWLSSRSVAERKKDKKLLIVTNASIVDETKMHLLEGWKQLMMTISIDAIGLEYEWIRHGLDWKEIESNIKRFQQLDNAIISVHSTVNLYNVSVIDRLFQWAEDNDLLFVVSPVVSPSLLSIHYAPIEILRKALENLSAIKPSRMQNKIQLVGLRNIITAAINDNCEDARLREQMTAYFNSHRKHVMDWKTLRCMT